MSTLLIVPDGVHIVVREGRTRHRLWVEGPPSPDVPLVAHITLDETAPIRMSATLQFWRFIATRQAHGSKPIPLQRHRRLVQALRALDGRLSGATYRVIAEGLHGSTHIDAETWKTASTRDTTIRLVRSGLAVMRGGYRKLLGSRRLS